MARKAHRMDELTMKTNSYWGNVSGVGIPMKMERCRVMDQPTRVPITTPENELLSTRMNASYMNSFIMTPRVQPMARSTEISLTCSYRLPVMLLDSEKKQMNIVIAIITLKIISSVCSACTHIALSQSFRQL